MSLQLLAKQMEAKGRGGDSVLVHMTAKEVAALQKMAESAGGSLSVNPETGLVEANFLKRMLPTLVGIGVGAFAGPVAGAAAGAAVGGYQAKRNDQDVGMGMLMGGLGGYGGASLGAGLGAAGATSAGAAGAGAAGAGAAGATAAPMTAAQGLSQAGQGISALGTDLGSKAFMSKVGGGGGLLSDVSMAAAPLMAPGKKPGEAPVDDEMYSYSFDPGRTYAERDPSATSAEREYFRSRYSPMRRIRASEYPVYAAQGGLMSLAEGGLVNKYDRGGYVPVAPKVTKDDPFYQSSEYKAYQDSIGPFGQVGTMDMYDSPYFGSVGSGSIGRSMDKVYEAYQQRLANQSPPPVTQAPPQPALGMPGGIGEPTMQVIVYGPDGTMYPNPAAARAAGVTNYTMQRPVTEANEIIPRMPDSNRIIPRMPDSNRIIPRMPDSGSTNTAPSSSEAALAYLMGERSSSAPARSTFMNAQLMGASPKSNIGVGADNMYAFDPATGTFLRNPNVAGATSSAVRGPVGTSFASSGGDGYQPAPPNPDFDTPEKQAAFYAENPTMGAITRAGQTALGFLPGASAVFAAQEAMNPGFAEQQRDITFGGSLSSGSVNDKSVTAGLGAIGYDDSAPDMSDFNTGGGGGGGGGGFTGGESQDHGGGGGFTGGESQDHGGGYDSGGYSATSDDSSYGGFFAQGGLMGLAKGGMASGGFVVPADVVSALGNGSTDAGLRKLSAMMGDVKPIKGKGDGLSDSIPTNIDGKQAARVADGEAYIDPKTVKRLGGAKKLYAMMDKIRAQAHGKTTQQRKVNPARVMA